MGLPRSHEREGSSRPPALWVLRKFLQDGATITFRFKDVFQGLSAATIRNLEFFGMTDKKLIYWFTTLATEGRIVEVEGLTIDTTPRPFLYAIPLRGLSLEDGPSTIATADFGVGFEDGDTVFQSILAESQLAKAQPVWAEDVPKVWGIVVAHDLLEAEALALTRARFIVGLFNLALNGGVSHFDTRYEKQFLDWNADVGKNYIRMEPWILLREMREAKGWIKALPLLDRQSDIQLKEGLPRIQFFLERFSTAMQVGDVMDQNRKGALTERERRIAEGIRRSVRWLDIAREETADADCLVATWVALEAIVNAIDYPSVFKASRSDLRDSLRGAIDAIGFPAEQERKTKVDADFVKGRVFSEEWPLRTKLELFGQSFGIRIRQIDIKIVRNAGRMRAAILHGRQDEAGIDREDIRRLALLTERLIVGASILGYSKVEDTEEDQLTFGGTGPEGAAAPLRVNGEEMAYTVGISQRESGEQVAELIAGGKIYELSGVQVSVFGDEEG